MVKKTVTVKQTVVLLSIVLFSFFINMPLANAQENIASYIVEVSYPPENENDPPEPVADVEVSVYLIAVLDENNLYQPKTAFSDFDFSGLEKMSAAEIQKTASLVADRVTQQEIPADMTEITAANGTAEFYDFFTYGLYLTVQTGSTGKAEAYSRFEPFLIQIPNYDVKQGWISEVNASPKLSLKNSNDSITTTTAVTTATTKITSVSTTTVTRTQTTSPEVSENSSTDSNKPKTGDENNLQLWQIVFGVSVLGIILLLADIVRDKRKKEK